MKSLKLSLFICIATTAIALISCKTDPCLNKVCKNLGVAKETPDGKSCTCECSVGYTGDSCQTTVLSTLTSKAWSATRTVNGVPKTTPYSVMFTQNLTSLTNIKLQNISNKTCDPGGTDVYTLAVIKSATKIEFDTTAQCGYNFIGGGEKQSDGSWIFTFDLKYGTTTDKVVATVK